MSSLYKNRRFCKLEQLPDRIVPSNFRWIIGAASTDWNAVGNWEVQTDGTWGAATRTPGSGDTAELRHTTHDCVVNIASPTVSQLTLDSSSATILTIPSGDTLTVTNGGTMSAGMDVAGALKITGGTFTVNGGPGFQTDAGNVTADGGSLTFANTQSLAVTANLNCDPSGSSNTDTIKFNGGASVVLTGVSGSAGPQITIGKNGTMEVDGDNNAGITRNTGSQYQVLDIQGTLRDGGTPAAAPNNYFDIDEPVWLDGPYAKLVIQANDGISFHGQTGSNPAGSSGEGTGNRGLSLFMDTTGGLIKLFQGATLVVDKGMQMDGGKFLCYSSDNTTAATWKLGSPNGNVYQNYGNFTIGGDNTNDWGALTISLGTGGKYMWYHGTDTFGYHTGQAISYIAIPNRTLELEAGVNDQAVAFSGDTLASGTVDVLKPGTFSNLKSPAWLPTVANWTASINANQMLELTK